MSNNELHRPERPTFPSLAVRNAAVEAFVRYGNINLLEDLMMEQRDDSKARTLLLQDGLYALGKGIETFGLTQSTVQRRALRLIKRDDSTDPVTGRRNAGTISGILAGWLARDEADNKYALAVRLCENFSVETMIRLGMIDRDICQPGRMAQYIREACNGINLPIASLDDPDQLKNAGYATQTGGRSTIDVSKYADALSHREGRFAVTEELFAVCLERATDAEEGDFIPEVMKILEAQEEQYTIGIIRWMARRGSEVAEEFLTHYQADEDFDAPDIETQ